MYLEVRYLQHGSAFGQELLIAAALRKCHAAHTPIAPIFAPLSGHHARLLRDTVRTMLPDFNESAETATLFFLSHESGNGQVFPPETAQPAMRLGRVFE
jgi:hypothetical protein